MPMITLSHPLHSTPLDQLRRPEHYKHCCIGIDPGATGAMVAIIIDGAWSRVELCPHKDASIRDLWNWLHRWGPDTPTYRTLAIMEQVTGYVEHNPTAESRMFQFGRVYGHLEALMVPSGILCRQESPSQWQGFLSKCGLLSLPPRVRGGDGVRRASRTAAQRASDRNKHKNYLKCVAQTLFPDVKVTLAIADALLLAEVCRRRYQRILK